MTPEAKVKAKVKRILDERGAYYFSPVTGGFGASGVPDIVVCYKGRFLGIECKAGKNKPTALQAQHMKRIFDADGTALWVNESTIDHVTIILDAFDTLTASNKNE